MVHRKEWHEFLQLTSIENWEDDPEIAARVEELRPLFWEPRQEELKFLVFPPYGKPRVIRTLKKVADLVRERPEKLRRIIDSKKYIGTYRGFGIELIKE